jgi:hypothetical protein
VGHQAPDFWKKLEILLSPVGGALTGIGVAFIGIYGASVLNRKQEIDARTKVYAELTSQREQADTELRKDMFAHIIDSVLKPENPSPDLTVLYVELLAYNFHESVDLKPLFSYVQRHLGSSEQMSAKLYLNRLEKVASDVTRKQLLVLEEGGQKFDRTIDLNALRDNPNGIVLNPESLKLAGIERVFQLVALSADRVNHEIRLRLEIITLKPLPETKSVTFSVGFYDFPMIDNTRLSEDQRCAVVLNQFCETPECNADVTLVYFHGSRASLKEKTFSEDVIRNLQKPSSSSDATKQ